MILLTRARRILWNFSVPAGMLKRPNFLLLYVEGYIYDKHYASTMHESWNCALIQSAEGSTYKVDVQGNVWSFCTLVVHTDSGSYAICLQDHLILSVPFSQTELDKKSCVYSAPATWNTQQNDLKLTAECF